MSTARIIYIYDTLCGWCNVARPQIQEVFAATKHLAPMVALHCRLFTDDAIPDMDEAFLDKVRRVGWELGPKLTGQHFSEKYLVLLQQPGFRHDSHLTSLACAAACQIGDPVTAFHYAEALQQAVFDEGQDPNSSETLIAVAESVGIERDTFRHELEKASTLIHATHIADEAVKLQQETGTQGVPLLMLEVLGRFTVLEPYHADKSIAEIEVKLGESLSI